MNISIFSDTMIKLFEWKWNATCETVNFNEIMGSIMR